MRFEETGEMPGEVGDGGHRLDGAPVPPERLPPRWPAERRPARRAHHRPRRTSPAIETASRSSSRIRWSGGGVLPGDSGEGAVSTRIGRSPGPDGAGGTSCVEVRGAEGSVLVLDAGTGIRPLGATLDPGVRRVHVLLTHLHMDHIQGLGFFKPLFDPEVETHLWGPATATDDLRRRLVRYLSPPLFPVHLRDLPRLVLHAVPHGSCDVGEFRVTAERICHPGHTIGYRIANGRHAVAYLSDHEPALGATEFPLDAAWTSGYALAEDVDLLFHDAQYGLDEYRRHVGWGHSALDHTLAFGDDAGPPS
jgi:ribonuclease BN (tRNA processing enzyme)